MHASKSSSPPLSLPLPPSLLAAGWNATSSQDTLAYDQYVAAFTQDTVAYDQYVAAFTQDIVAYDQ